MIKNAYILFFIFTVGVTQLNSQNSINHISINDLKGVLNSNGILFDSSSNQGLFVNRNNDLFGLIQTGGIWLKAIDSVNNLHLAAHNMLGNNHEFWSGPLQLQNAQSANPAQWNKVYSISKDEILKHLNEYKNSSYVPSNNIINWPGSLGAPYADILAPFVDNEDNNLKYEPMKGDYPYIECDQLLYSITNDNYANHSYSGGLLLGVEVHTSLYGFKSNDSFLKQAFIVKYAIINRSNNNYTDFSLSQAIQFKIGSNFNEFLGTDISNKTLFAYNDSSEATFGNKMVSSGCMLLNGKLNSTMYFENSNNLIYGKPLIANDFLNYMQSKWKNGQHLTFGSNGVDGSGQANYIYPFDTDNSNSNTMWNETSVGNLSGQRIGLMNTEQVSLKRGESKVYDFAFYFVEGNSYNIKQISNFCLGLKSALKDKITLKNYQENVKHKPLFSVYPNPIHSGGVLNLSSEATSNICINLYTMDGNKILTYNLEENKNSINLPHYLDAGLYIIEIKTLNNTTFKKLTIN